MATRPTSLGSSRRRASSRTSPCSTSRRDATERSNEPTSSTIMPTTATSARAASACGNDGRCIANHARSENDLMRYRASKLDCDACGLKQRCTPNMLARKILRSIHEGARDLARDLVLTEAYLTSRRERKKVEMLFAHLKRILKLDRLRLRGPNGAKDEFLLAATAQNLRKLAKLIPIPQPAPA